MLAWCVCPLFSSLTNDELGLYDGFSETLDQTLAWGVPYFMGRLYLGDAAGLRADLVVGVVLGGLLYIPLCLYEMRATPTAPHAVRLAISMNSSKRFGWAASGRWCSWSAGWRSASGWRWRP